LLNRKPKLTQYSDYLGLGIQIAATMVVPMLFGLWLDRTFDTSPWLLLAGSVFGILSIFGIIYKVAIIANDKSDKERKKKNSG
jgi:F0F1-type ATP synthase assembly protein I